MAKVVSKDESWGKSILVENVQALENSTADIPEIYIRPDLDIGTEKFSEEKLPIIDMSRLLNSNFSCEECSKLDLACKQWGFFQLVNHGIDDEVMDKMEGDLKEFFKLSLEEKEVFAPVCGGLQGYGQKLDVNEEKLEWHDLLFLITRPLDSKNLRFWPTHPPSFRSTLEKYSLELKRVSQCLFEVIAKNLGLKQETLLNVVDDHQGIRMHYYPPCSKANKVLGLNPHSDVGVLTLLHQVGDVQGLQIKRNGKWLPVEQIPHAFVINISDVLEVIN
ncbi:putative (S)-norcoclaurine synthase [Dioscorea sansibarensis]